MAREDSKLSQVVMGTVAMDHPSCAHQAVLRPRRRTGGIIAMPPAAIRGYADAGGVASLRPIRAWSHRQITDL